MRERRYTAIKRVLWIILFANFAVAAIKIGVGTACKIQSVLADGIHSLSDGSSNIVGLIGIWLASKPSDAKHPYGHSKYEIIASLFIGVMLAAIAVRIIIRAVSSLLHPSTLIIDTAEILLMLFTIVINTVVAVTEYRSGKKFGSTILVTDSLHTRGDILISCTVLLVLLGIKAGLPTWFDGIITLLVGIVVSLSAGKIIKYCVDILVDSTVINEDDVKSLLTDISEIRNIHKVRSRGENAHTFIELHAVVNPCENIERLHTLSHRMEALLKERFGDETEVNIHLEPDDGRHG